MAVGERHVMPHHPEKRHFIPPVRIVYSAGLTLALLVAGIVAKDRIITWINNEADKKGDSGTGNVIPTPVPGVIIGGDRYILTPTASATLAETATPPPSPSAISREAVPTAPATTPAIATATAIPEKYRTENGNLVYKIETGESLAIPSLLGTKAELREIEGQKKVIYIALAENPYGLKEKAVAGLFYPEFHDIKDSRESEQVGGVGIRAEVARYFEQKAGSPQQSILFPLYVDPTFAKDKEKVTVQFVETTTGRTDLFLKVPLDAKLITPIERSVDQSIKIEFSPQDWGTVINIGTPGIFSGNQFYFQVEYAKVLEGKTDSYKLGDPFLTVDASSFSDDLINFYNTYRKPSLVGGPNANTYGKSRVQDSNGRFSSYSFSKKNVLAFGKSYAFLLANDNPLLKN